MSTIKIPGTIEEAKDRLGGIERLLTATDWERAAIVYAFTEDGGQGGRPSADKPRDKARFTCREFARLGIHGLRGDQAVRAHRNNWALAIENGWAVEVAPGDEVALPDEDYPRTSEQSRLVKGVLRDATPDESMETFRDLMARPEVAKRIEGDFVRRAGQDPALAGRVMSAFEEFHPAPEPPLIPVGAEIMALVGVGGGVYSAVARFRPQVLRLAEYVRDRAPLAGVDAEEIKSVIASLEKARNLITQYEDALRAATGVDYDAVFDRLVNG